MADDIVWDDEPEIVWDDEGPKKPGMGDLRKAEGRDQIVAKGQNVPVSMLTGDPETDRRIAESLYAKGNTRALTKSDALHAGAIAGGTALAFAGGLPAAIASGALTAGGASEQHPVREGAIGAVGGAVADRFGRVLPVLAKALRKGAVNAGRRVLQGGGSISVKKPVSDEAILEAGRQGAFRPLGTIEGAADRIGAARERVGAQYGDVVDALEAAGVKGPDADVLAQQLRAKGASAFQNSALPEVQNVYNRTAAAIQRVSPATPARVMAKATNLDWPAAPNLELPFAGRTAHAGPTAAYPAPEPVAQELGWQLGLPGAERRAPLASAGPDVQWELPPARPWAVTHSLDSAAASQNVVPGQTPLPLGDPVGTPRLIPGTMRPQPGPSRVLLEEKSAIPVSQSVAYQDDLFGAPARARAVPGDVISTQPPATSQSVAYQESLLPKSRRLPDRPKPVPVSTEIEFTPEKPGNLRLGQGERIKRAHQQKARYDKVQGDTVMEGSRKDIASTIRQANEDAIEAQKHLAPDLAERFVPLKRQTGLLIEAGDAADIGAARAARRHFLSPRETVIATGALAGGGIPAGAITGTAAHLLNTRGGSTAAWAGLRGADFFELPQNQDLVRQLVLAGVLKAREE
jgi:hypothetical protein